MFLLKNSNLVSLNLVGKVFANVFFQIEKEIKVPWGENGNGSETGNTLVRAHEEALGKAASPSPASPT